MPLHTSEAPRLYRQIADQLRKRIMAGHFEVGARLPAERDLARDLGVSRPSVREALIALEVEGWVEVRTGSGVYVMASDCALAPTQASLEWGPLELIRARLVVEGEIAAVAAVQRKRAHVDAMNRAIDAMREMAAQHVMPLDADRAFHVALAQASDNVVLVETVQGFWTSRRGPIFTRLSGYFETPDSWRKAIAEHEAIRDAVAARDAEAAREAMHTHMRRSHQRYSASWRRARKSSTPAPPAHLNL